MRWSHGAGGGVGGRGRRRGLAGRGKEWRGKEAGSRVEGRGGESGA